MSQEITDLNSILKNLDQLKEELEAVNDTSLAELSQSIATISNDISSFGTNSMKIFADMVTGINNFYIAMMTHPYGALATVIGGLAIAVLNTTNNMEELSEKENAEAAQRMIDKYSEIIDRQTDLHDSFKKSADSINEEYAVAQHYFDELYKMMESGKPIDNLETAQFYIEQLNRIGIDGISITDKKLVQLDKEKKIYEEQIEQFKIKAMLQAHEAEYGSALITQKTLVDDLVKARQDLNNEEQINSEILMDYINKYPTYSEALNACVIDHGSFAKGLSESKTILDEMNESFVKNQESLNT